MVQPITCTIRDKSFSGAMIEFAPDRFNSEITEVVVGDELTLTMKSSQERTSVRCLVVRVAGRRCGLKFVGQFHTEINKPKKASKDAAAQDGASKAVKPKFGGPGRGKIAGAPGNPVKPKPAAASR